MPTILDCQNIFRQLKIGERIFICPEWRADPTLSGGGELVVVAGSEDELGSCATVSLGKGEAEAAGAAGDEDDLLACASIETGTESVGCRSRGDAGEELGGVECGFGFLHSC